jgi:hypothetical protein
VSLVRWVCFHEDNIVAVALIIIVFWCKSSVLPLLVWSLLSLTCIAHIKGDVVVVVRLHNVQSVRDPL